MAINGTATAVRPTEERTFVEAALTLEPLQISSVDIRVEGLSPLSTHRWSEKAKRMMLEAQSGKARKRKEPKDPDADYNDARYRIDAKRDGIPAICFKAAIVGAARHFEGIPMTVLKTAIFVEGIGKEQLIPIEGKPEKWEATVRIAMGTADLRYRPLYWPWSAVLPVRFVASTISLDAVYALVDAAGLGGVGEWRPSAPKSLTGSYGRFKVSVEA